MTTDSRIQKALQNTPKFTGVYLYDQLKSLPLLNNNVIVVNYVTTEEARQGIVGHYVVLDARNDTVKGQHNTLGTYFFDPYGLTPDTPARELLGLPNTMEITKYLNRSGKYTYNTKDFQVERPWDDLCGAYAVLYTENPNFNTNPIFIYKNRVELDENLEKLYKSIGFLGKLPNYPLIRKSPPQV